MNYVFYGPSKLIVINSGITSLAAQDIYSDWKEWVGSGVNSAYLPAFNSIGGDPVTATKSVAPYFFLLNGWRLRPWEGSHQLDVDGNLFVDGGVGNPFVTTTGSHNVFINIQTSNNAVVVSAGGGADYSSDLTTIKKKIDDLTALSI